MELYLQLGYGMMEHCRHLVRSWNGGTVILSPRDLEPAQLKKLSDEIRAIPGGQVLVDTQFYVPRSDHHRLTAHDYWPDSYQTNAFFAGPGIQRMLDAVMQLNEDLHCSAIILPGLMATSIDDIWLDTLRATVEQASNNDAEMYATIALSANSVRDSTGIQDIIAEFESLAVDGAYLLFEHPNGEYIVQDPLWLTNALELAAGLRLLGKKVIVGYACHELLCLGAASIDAIASGTWLNVRAFSPDRFLSAEDDIKRKAVWYYDPNSLSEYKIAFLDIAQQRGVLQSMAPPVTFGSGYAAPLFSGVQPSSVGFGEQEAFRHYLQCMFHQTRGVRDITFDSTVAKLRLTMDSAEEQAKLLAKNGVLAGVRSFSDGYNVVRSALISLENTRGPLLRRHWANL